MDDQKHDDILIASNENGYLYGTDVKDTTGDEKITSFYKYGNGFVVAVLIDKMVIQGERFP